MPDKVIEEGRIPQTEEEIREQLGDDAPPIEKVEEKVEEKKDEKDEKTEEVVITLATGEVFKGATEKEVLDKIVHSKEEATRTIRDRENQIRELKGEKKPEKQEDGFSKEAYYDLLADDPMAAFNYQMAFAMGIRPEDVAPALRYTLNTSQMLSAQQENAIFRTKFPDAPEGDDFADKMIERLTAENRDWTARNLTDVYRALVDEGAVKPVKAEEKKEEKRSTPPPSLGKPKADTPAEEDFERMTTDEMEKYLRKIGQL